RTDVSSTLCITCCVCFLHFICFICTIHECCFPCITSILYSRKRKSAGDSLYCLLEAFYHERCSNSNFIRVTIGASTCIRQPECFFSRGRRSIICWKSIISNRKSSYYICTVRVLRGISWYHFL